ncbi:unnamed protein product [Ascophyllum nodosum]
MKTVEAKRTVEEEAAEIERAHDSRLEEHLEKEREWLEELGRRGVLLEQREEDQDLDCPLAMAVGQQPELSILSPVRKKPSEVEPPPHTVARVERSVCRKGWKQAMPSKFEWHMKTGTFSMVDRVPEGRKPVGSKWCFHYKTYKEGKIIKFKAKLVIKGVTQIRNVDYTHPSFPCPSSASIKLVLAVANERGLSLYHFNVGQAYIRASLDDEAYFKFPSGCDEKSKKTAKLERTIYDLKQSGRNRGHLCGDILTADGFEQCKADPCIFRKIVDGVVVMIIGVYVDGLLVGGSQEYFESLLLLSLNKKFSTNDLGECTWYDGCSIERNAELGTIKLSQEAFMESLMTRFDVHTTSDIPASPGADLGPERDDESGEDWTVREAAGSLL